MSGFAVGELATFICDIAATPEFEFRAYDGQDAIVVSPLEWHRTWDAGRIPSVTFGYAILYLDGVEVVAEPHELRKKHPPASDESEHRKAMLDCIERAKRGIEVPA